ncbi:MAG: hypothetical protein HDT42_06200 [Ruminococcaceae bacterium]|nr:hypothetical protein [Oscillospiraceae bacterium]
MKGSIKVSDDSGYSKDKSGRQIRYGGKLYCPTCVTERKGEPDGIAATAAVIDRIWKENDDD